MIDTREEKGFLLEQIKRSIKSRKISQENIWQVEEIFTNIKLDSLDCRWMEIIIECLSIIFTGLRHELSEFLLKLAAHCKEITLSERAKTMYNNLLTSS